MALASRTPTPDVARSFLKKLGEIKQRDLLRLSATFTALWHQPGQATSQGTAAMLQLCGTCATVL